MVQGFYTLEEAARYLGVAEEELNQMAQKREIRAFADRGTWRFRTQDVEELARRRGKGSNPDLQLGEGARPAPAAAPEDSSVFTFSLGADDEEVKFGEEKTREGPSSVHGPGSGSGKSAGPKSPSPKPGSDSDVRLVSEGSDVNFKIASDSAIKTVGETGSKSGKKGGKSDSDVKIVPDQGPGDSVVPIGGPPAKSGTDSDIRLEGDSGSLRPDSQDESMLTEEIDLDAELKQAEKSTRSKSKIKKPKAPEKPAAEVTSPFELSDSDLEDEKGSTKPLPKPTAKKRTPESSDIDMTAGGDSSPVSRSSDEMPTLKPRDEEVDLGERPAVPVGESSDSGISLQAAADSGISLEKKEGDSSEEVEFELSLDPESTPKPKPAAPMVEDDSSSEFELTLDDSGGLAPIEEEAQASGSGSGEKDIFETDFDVPALEDESGSQAVALDESSDTDLESSDFDLALGDEDAGSEEESGSQVVVLEDEEEADEGAATVARSARRRQTAVAEDVDESGEVPVEELPDEDEEIPIRRRAAVSEEWPTWVGIVLIPCVIVMFLVGIMGFETLHSMWGYRQPGKVSGVFVRTFADMFGAELPKD
jgi:excisionase family DNA binding protein